MHSESARAPRLVIVDPNLKSLHGHYYGYASRIGHAAQALGVDPWTVASRAVTLAGGPVPIVAGLSQNYWEELRPLDGEDPYVHLARSAQCFADELEAVLSRLTIDGRDVLFLPYANLAEVEGLTRIWHDTGGQPPRIVLLFRRDLEEQGVDARVGTRTVAVLLRRAIAELTMRAGGDRVRVFTDSDELTEDHADRLQVRVQTAPIPVDRQFSTVAGPRPPHPTVISYFGDARTEKGYHQLPALADALAPALATGRVRLVLQSNFNLPGGEAGIPAAREALGAHPNVELLLDPLDDHAYCGRMAESHLVLLPYHAERYVARTSGIHAEAIHAGVPVIVPDGTWMAEQIRRGHGAGLAYDPCQADGFVRAVERAIDRLPSLLATAHARRGSFMSFHNPDRMARFVCGANVIEEAISRIPRRLAS
jgi:glycosyltransferase involved in cell wall biosynthesis